MSCVYVVGISCKETRKVEKPYKTLLYCFEVTWSDESRTVKELNIDSFHLFRKKLKTETYKTRPDVSFPEVPDGKVGKVSGFISKAKKAEKRRKQIEEFCTQIINLPHVQGKLQAIRSLFSATEDGQTQSTIKVEAKDDDGKTSGSEADDKQSDADYVTVIRRTSAMEPKAKKGVQLNYVQVEFLNPQVRAAKPTIKPVYAEVVLSKQPKEWLFQVDGEEEGGGGEGEDKDEQRIKISPSVSNKCSTPPPPPPIESDDDEVAEKAEVLVPGEAHEMPDADESTPKPSTAIRISQRSSKRTQTGIFDAAMLSNFPEGTLVPLPPSFSTEPCPVSADLKLSKNGHPPKDDPNNVYVVSICGWKAKGENSLSFKRGQRALLLYTSTTWWFISTGMSIGWVPGDHWRIVAHSKTVSGKPLPAFSPWNFGILDRKECEAILKKGNPQDFLIRESSNSTGHLVLSVLHNGRVHHFEVQQQTEQGLFYIGCHHFKTIHNVVLYYKRKTLFVDEDGNNVRLGRLFREPKT